MAQPTSITEPEDPELQGTAWDLEPLVEGEGEEGVERRLKEALDRANAFAEEHAGKVAELDAALKNKAKADRAASLETQIGALTASLASLPPAASADPQVDAAIVAVVDTVRLSDRTIYAKS